MVRVSIVIPTHNRKEKLARLLASIFESDFSGGLEVIVVDDASTDGTCEFVRKLFPAVRVVRNERESYIAAARNAGIREARGDYIFLIDDDNVVDKLCISELVRTFEMDPRIGVAAPIMYYFSQPERVWCAGVARSMTTSLTRFLWRDAPLNKAPRILIESADFPNAFMVRREVIEKVGIFDGQLFPIHYEEADFGERVRRAGFRIVCNPRAKVWHDIPLPEKEARSRLLHVHSKLRAYYAARNRVCSSTKSTQQQSSS